MTNTHDPECAACAHVCPIICMICEDHYDNQEDNK